MYFHREDYICLDFEILFQLKVNRDFTDLGCVYVSSPVWSCGLDVSVSLTFGQI